MLPDIMKAIPGPTLARIQTPSDLRKLPESDLPLVCNELRQFIIDTVSMNGGHFAASLGVVELTVALHYVFETPDDQLIWDVGHQAYGHKILTGRREQFHTNRVYKGLSGFPKRSESPYDAFGVGHSSTSISAALGMAVASRLQGNHARQHVAVIGDGALTAGMAFEGLNHGGVEDSNLLVVLNDNCMSIDPNVGALKEYLTDIAVSPAYNAFKEDVWHALERLQKVGRISQKLLSKVQQTVKGGLLKQSNLFEALRFRYFGPVDGHDVLHLVKLFRDLKNIPGPKLLHCLTVKGKGFAPAEKEQTKWHAPGLFDKISGEIYKRIPETPQPPKYQDVFGHTLVELAGLNPAIVGVTPAMLSGCSMTFLQKAYPERTFDVGIAEQHAVTFSAGMAASGMVPFCNIYSSFMQRAYDQVVHDVALQKLKVIFCLDRAGIAGADGPTHHGALDLAYMRCVPNLIVGAPMNEEELRNMMFTAQLPSQHSAMVIRYPRGNGVMTEWRTPFQTVDIGKGRQTHEGNDVALVTIGHAGNFALKAAHLLEKEGISAAHFDMRWAKPLDEALLHDVCTRFQEIITVEDGTILGGFGGAVAEFATTHGYGVRITRLGMPDRILEHGEQPELYAECGYDATSIAQEVKRLMGMPVQVQ
jgi:1-deoxy-D-xylulose-5-phosphate synthase